MRKTFSIIFFLSILGWIHLYAKNCERKSIYEHGKVVKSLDDNFTNLTNNWWKIIQVEGNITIVSYKLSATLSTDSLIDGYNSRINNPDIYIGRFGTSKTQSSKVNKGKPIIRLLFTPVLLKSPRQIGDSLLISTDSPLFQKSLNQYVSELQDGFRKSVKVGDKVYIVKLFINGIVYNHYVVCSEKTKRVVWDTLFGGIYY